MWIVALALRRPYTFVVMALLIIILTPVTILRTPVDIFPDINIPVVSVVWNYGGLSPQEMADRIVTNSERGFTVTVNDIEHQESQSLNGIAVIKIFFRPSVNIAMAVTQVTAICQTTLRSLPLGTTPPLVITYTASSTPVVQLGLSSKTLPEQQVFDLAQNFLRTQLSTVQGAGTPYPFGGKPRQIQVDLDIAKLQAYGLSPNDIVNAVAAQNLILPAGTTKIGPTEYNVELNGSPRSIADLNNLPVKTTNSATLYLRDVAHVRDGFIPQTNIVRQDGTRGVLMSMFKLGGASTLTVVKDIKAIVPIAAQSLPPELNIKALFDQSLFVRASIDGVLREGLIAACLTAAMILIFLGDWRPTVIIAVSIPLSIFVSVILLSALGETINIMTLGGLALAVGILVDDATVEIENIERNLAMGKEMKQAILDGAQQIAVPALVSTLCICIVFIPMFFLTGVARYLFVPLAEAVVFAMLASYLLSRTLVPTLAMYLLRPHQIHTSEPKPWNLPARFQQAFERGFEKFRAGYIGMLDTCIRHRGIFVPAFLGVCASAFLLVPWLGRDFFPTTDAGQFNLHFRAKTGTRIEETARLGDLIESSMRETIPESDLASIIDNIGVPYSSINMTYSNSLPIGTMDADILVTLNPEHRPTDYYMHELRRKLPREFPGVTFYFLPADIISQILNFGLPAPIDVQVSGPNLEGNHLFATNLLSQLQNVPGAVDLRIHQLFDLPRIQVNVDRTKAIESGYTQLDVANSLLISLSGSFQTTPAFWLDPKNGVEYSLATQTPQYDIGSVGDINNVPITSAGQHRAEIMGDVVSTSRRSEMAVVSHYNIARAIDIYGNVQDRDLGGVATDIDRIVDKARAKLPRGSQLFVRGQIDTMQSSFRGLLGGLVLSIILVYFLIVINFQSWLDPFIIITALPAAMAGIVLFLFVSRTTLSIPALMGAIMSVGVATSNSILVISFAKEHLETVGDPVRAAQEAGFTRFRPVLMTALAMIIGMVPMALGLGDGGEQNAPLGRAVIGGLLFATFSTLLFVPTFFSVLHRNRANVHAR